MHEVAIIGSGPAGYTAGVYAGRANLKPILFEGLESGGQLMLTTDVENYPGFEDGIMGPELMQVFKKQAQRFGTEIKTETVDSIEKIDDGFSQKPSNINPSGISKVPLPSRAPRITLPLYTEPSG